jgi:hypothetical protein
LFFGYFQPNTLFYGRENTFRNIKNHQKMLNFENFSLKNSKFNFVQYDLKMHEHVLQKLRKAFLMIFAQFWMKIKF